MSDLITVEITGEKSAFKKGDQININSDFELEAYESIVAFYNSSMTFAISKFLLFILIAACFVEHFKF